MNSVGKERTNQEGCVPGDRLGAQHLPQRVDRYLKRESAIKQEHSRHSRGSRKGGGMQRPRRNEKTRTRCDLACSSSFWRPKFQMNMMDESTAASESGSQPPLATCVFTAQQHRVQAKIQPGWATGESSLNWALHVTSGCRAKPTEGGEARGGTRPKQLTPRPTNLCEV